MPKRYGANGQVYIGSQVVISVTDDVSTGVEITQTTEIEPEPKPIIVPTKKVSKRKINWENVDGKTST